MYNVTENHPLGVRSVHSVDYRTQTEHNHGLYKGYGAGQGTARRVRTPRTIAAG